MRGGELLVLALAGVAAACATAGRAPRAVDLDAAVRALQRPLPGRMAALYRLRVAESGGLRLAVVGTPEAGRLTVSRQLGGTVLAAEWSSGELVVVDLQAGCTASPEVLSRITGLGVLPPGAALRLLAGRLPGGEVVPVEPHAGLLELEGRGWAARVVVAGPPWRVTRMEGLSGWRIELGEHTAAVPGWVRVERADGEWFELRLVRLEWGGGALPPLPDLPPCPRGGSR